MVRHHMVTQEQADQIYAEPIHYIAYGQWLTGTAYIPIQLNESVFSFEDRKNEYDTDGRCL